MTVSKGIYVRRGTRTKWAAEQDGKHSCKCGCGETILVVATHYPDVPRFRHGHSLRDRASFRSDWVAEQQGRHQCKCGCGTPIRVLAAHHSEGIPDYVSNHHPKTRPSRPVAPPRPCGCGCQQMTAPGAEYLHGHNSRQLLRDLFWKKTSPAATTNCWPWSGTFSQKGYAVMNHRSKHLRAARVSYELFRGPITEGREPDHTCRMRGCVNPWHLDLVTHTENMRRVHLTAEAHRALMPQMPPGWQP